MLCIGSALPLPLTAFMAAPSRHGLCYERRAQRASSTPLHASGPSRYYEGEVQPKVWAKTAAASAWGERFDSTSLKPSDCENVRNKTKRQLTAHLSQTRLFQNLHALRRGPRGDGSRALAAFPCVRGNAAANSICAQHGPAALDLLRARHRAPPRGRWWTLCLPAHRSDGVPNARPQLRIDDVHRRDAGRRNAR